MHKQDSAFAFIQQYNEEWAVLAKEFEKLLFKDRDASFFKARKLAELLIKDVYKKEGIEYPNFATQAEKITILKNEGVLDEELFSPFDRIRRMGNLAVHEHKVIPISDGLKIHSNVYTILKWFVESYVSYDFKVPDYQEPKPENLDEVLGDKVRDLLKEYLPSFIPAPSPTPTLPEGAPTSLEVTVEEEVLPELNGSHLLYELSKLRESSQDAVEGYKGLSDFKRYMHVKRPIESKLEKILEESVHASSGQLIFLCGSVGDGKSHLLSHMNSTKKDIMSHFNIHNDATESFDPKKNSLDTLSEVLDSFSDEKLGQSGDKLILAINLGVLNNFIESEYASEKYQKLREFIANANVFESNVITTPEEHSNFKLVNFSDYNAFELTVEGPVSSYISELFDRISSAEPNNPYYKAYLKDKEKFSVNPLLINYEMFSSKSVQKQIIQLIIKTIMKDKVILSSRALLNFIYDILVPVDSSDVNTSDFIDMLPSLLPNLLFEGIEKSHFLKMMSNHDPIHHRAKELDEKLISLHNSGSYYVFFRDVIFDSSAQEWINGLETIEDIAYLDKDTKRELSELFIRSTYLYESHLQACFQDIVYANYMKFLYAYNTNKKPMLQNLYYEIEKSIYLWKGSPSSGYLFIDDESNAIRIAEPLQLRKVPLTIENEKIDFVERFTPTLYLGFKCEPDQTVHEVEIDLPLYDMVTRVLNGYKLNKKDREDSIQFIDFIERLLPYGKQQEEILISDMDKRMTFRLQFDADFGVYSFSREQ
ncbi:DNA phosphorothioation-dependent restriction protein DptF [Peribacillus alkalitolerans]|uniref:DNA phosphorothioation-dependent restriction protein DptF n=1 Tax=Peribacillus alkalitolerans TaxID=1550385 RepID=UPI0013D83AEE|nr:DNA phosphorothioation-dependent restriction protein DptF [Peribacillus alkalitolerans]